MSEERDFHTILSDHLRRYPAMEVQDMYKLIHQASLGSEHAVKTQEHVWKMFEREMDALGLGPQEPMIDPISVEGDIVRVNLRPFLSSKGNTTVLLQAFIQTANEFHGLTNKLRSYWRAVEELARKGALALTLDDVRSFFNQADDMGFPAMHHSNTYTQSYRPAYRVVAREFLQDPFPIP